MESPAWIVPVEVVEPAPETAVASRSRAVIRRGVDELRRMPRVADERTEAPDSQRSRRPLVEPVAQPAIVEPEAATQPTSR